LTNSASDPYAAPVAGESRGALLEGRVGLVTGAGRGLGRAIAQAFAAAACRVAVLDIDLETAQQTVEQLTEQGADAFAVGVDISSEPEVREAVAAVVDRFGALDVACNNAVGLVDTQMIHEFDVDDARRMIDVALLGTALCLKHELRVMRAHGGGAIVNIVSTAPHRGQRGNGIYGACKVGIEALTKVAANENGPDGIRVNAVAAGGMLTPALQEVLDAVPGSKQRVENAVPLRHIADPAEVADVALFLASDLARYVTGAVLFADGGGILHGSSFESAS
jgi:NAD(P)-dependent dehydrogenase (short-subunit alcohol dehydrogenase family)